MGKSQTGFRKDFLLYYLILGGMLFTHSFYVFFFHIIGSPFMSAMNIFSVIFYIVLTCMFLKSNQPKLFIFVIIEVVIHAFFAVIVTGIGNGFELFMVCSAFASHYLVRVTRSSKAIAYISNTLSFILLLAVRFVPVVADISSLRVSTKKSYLDAIYSFNLIIAFIMIFYIMLIFMKEISNDEEKLKQLNYRLSKLASHDSLTQLLNRRAMKQKLEYALELRKKHNIEFVTAIADIDDFKKINDRYGHDCGDQALKKVVQVIKENVRGTDYISRWGGDEILILFNGSTLEGALICIERIHKEIANSTFIYNNEVINLTITIGVCPSDNYSMYQDIILEADRRLYDGKHKGKNCVVYEAPPAPAPATNV